MEYKSSSYSPNIIIFIRTKDQRIRLSDVLCYSATLYNKEFQDIPPGTPAELVFSIDNRETAKNIILSQGLKNSMDIFEFSEN